MRAPTGVIEAIARLRDETLANPRRIKRFTREQHFKTAAEMAALFAA